MRPVSVSVVLVACCCLGSLLRVPPSHAATHSARDRYLLVPDSPPDAYLDGPTAAAAVKRAAPGVDAWSICPPHMTDVDCFYAYLRVYARLRKAAEDSDRVSMRNIGKRAGGRARSLHVALQPSRGGGPITASAAARGNRKLMELCPERMTPAQCYQVIRNVYQKVQAFLLNSSSDKEDLEGV